MLAGPIFRTTACSIVVLLGAVWDVIVTYYKAGVSVVISIIVGESSTVAAIRVIIGVAVAGIITGIVVGVGAGAGVGVVVGVVEVGVSTTGAIIDGTTAIIARVVIVGITSIN